MYKRYWPSWDRTSQSFAARPRSVRGWDCARTMTLVVAKCCGAEPEGSRTASPLSSAWQPNPFSTANRRWASSIAGCGPSVGAPKAITAAAHKLARIVYHLLTTRQPYDDSVFTNAEERYRRRAEFRLKAQARALGFTLTPVTISGKEVP
jgi:hypothetical protein